MICTNCALFGNHRSHNIHSEEDVISLLEIKGQELVNIFKYKQNNKKIVWYVRENTFWVYVNAKECLRIGIW